MSKPKISLFEGRIEMEKAVIQWDKACSGLGIRLNKNGTQVYIAKVSVNGQPKWYTLGPLDVVVLEQARKLVSRMKMLARSGESPDFLLTAFFKTEDLDPNTGITFDAFVTKYIDDYAKVYRKSWLKDEQRLKLYLVPKWRGRQLKEITREDFFAIFKKMKKKPTAANRLKETLTTVFKQAIVMGYLRPGHPSPTFEIKRYKTRPRREKVSLSEMPVLAAKIRAARIEEVFKKALLFVLYTGCRHGEAVSLKWSYFDFKNRLLTIPETKNGEPHVLPLSEPLIRLMNSIRRTGPWVFPSRLTGRNITSLQKPWARVRCGGFEHITIHSLRRSAGCIVLEQTGSLSAVRDMLNHTNEHVSAIYGFYDNKSLAPIVDRYNAAIESAWLEG